MRYRGDYNSRTRKFLQRHLVNNDKLGLYKELNNTSLWENIPKNRQKQRKKHLLSPLPPSDLEIHNCQVIPQIGINELSLRVRLGVSYRFLLYYMYPTRKSLEDKIKQGDGNLVGNEHFYTALMHWLYLSEDSGLTNLHSAIKHFGKAIVIRAQFYDNEIDLIAYLYRGFCYCELGDIENALNDFKVAFSRGCFKPSYYYFMYTLAYNYLGVLCSDYEKSIGYFNVALNEKSSYAKPGFFFARFNRAVTTLLQQEISEDDRNNAWKDLAQVDSDYVRYREHIYRDYYCAIGGVMENGYYYNTLDDEAYHSAYMKATYAVLLTTKVSIDNKQYLKALSLFDAAIYVNQKSKKGIAPAQIK